MQTKMIALARFSLEPLLPGRAIFAITMPTPNKTKNPSIVLKPYFEAQK
jgi:hypothetical protein